MGLRNMSELGIIRCVNPNWFTSCCYLQASEFPRFQQLFKKFKRVFKCKYSSLLGNLFLGETRSHFRFSTIRRKSESISERIIIRQLCVKGVILLPYTWSRMDNILPVFLLWLQRAYCILFLSCILRNIPNVHKELSTI